MGFLDKIFGTHSDHELKRIRPIADKVDALEEEYKKLIKSKYFFNIKQWQIIYIHTDLMKMQSQ